MFTTKLPGNMHKRLTPKFSIITITYNAGEVLEDTIQSVITQTYHHVEYIIVDGASKDETLEIVQRYRAYIHKFVSEPDKGIYDAMNKGLAMATGDYVCFLNAGDSLHADDTLAQMVHAIRTPELPDVIYGETALVDKDRRFMRMRHHSVPDQLTWKSFKKGMLVCHQAFFAKRALTSPYDLRYRFSADFDWCIRVLKQAKSFLNTRRILIDYLEEGITTANRKASLKERFRIMALHYGWLSTIIHHFWFVVRYFRKSAG